MLSIIFSTYSLFRDAYGAWAALLFSGEGAQFHKRCAVAAEVSQSQRTGYGRQYWDYVMDAMSL